MCWVAADRMARSVRAHGLPGPAERWEELRDQIHHDVVTHAFDAGRNTFTQAYGSSALDASLLLIPRAGFLPATDPRVLGTIAAVRRELSDGDLVRRYQTSQTDDGLKGPSDAARRGKPLAGHDRMILRSGMRAALATGPDGHRFLVEGQARDYLRP
jgi:GH15 family glucan-1,4-alpha-glucosidase